MDFYLRLAKFAALMFLLVLGLRMAVMVSRGESVSDLVRWPQAVSAAPPPLRAQRARPVLPSLPALRSFNRRQRLAMLWGAVGAAFVSMAVTRGWFKGS